MGNKKLAIPLLGVVMLAFATWFFVSRDQPPIETWQLSNESSSKQIDHTRWQATLDDFLFVADKQGENTGVNLFDYEALIEHGRENLSQYIVAMAKLNIVDFRRDQQFAYWVNLYNALTVDLVADHYPVESITKIPGPVTAFGPWDNPAIEIMGESLSLNDIEHRILRPIWKDYRIHFALNCASIGCPNLQAQAFTAENSEAQLNQATKEFLAHPRGMSLSKNGLTLSSIFEWYLEDFGNDEASLLKTIGAYINPAKLKQAQALLENISYQYDWRLNDDA